MKKQGRAVLALAGALLLSGCVHTVWQKPGASQSDYEQIKSVCMMEGHDRVPQDNRTYMVSEGHTYMRDKCKNDRDCASTAQYTPPQYGVYDQNEDLRNQVVRACMYRNGWNEVNVDE